MTDNAVAFGENNAITKTAVPIQNMADLMVLAEGIARSGMFGMSNVGKGLVIATTCLQDDMSLLEFKRTFHVSDKGDIMMRSDRMLAEFQSRGGKCRWIEHSQKRAAASFSFGENKDVEIDYTIEEAKEAGYVRNGSGWTKDPGAQLRARLITRAVRMICPGAIAGTYTPEEMADLYGAEQIESDAKPEPITPKTKPDAKPALKPKAAKKAEAKEEPVEVVALDAEYYETCPIKGKLFGVRWDEMSQENLTIALNLKNEMMEPEHRRQIAMALDENYDVTIGRSKISKMEEELPF